jgi:hypothetical protein
MAFHGFFPTFQRTLASTYFNVSCKDLEYIYIAATNDLRISDCAGCPKNRIIVWIQERDDNRRWFMPSSVCKDRGIQSP